MEPNRPMLRKQGRAVADTFGVISADFNRDGLADLAVITPGAELLILLGLDSGLYRRSFRCRVDSRAQGLHTEDLNGDGINDLAVACPDRQGFNLLRGHGDGTFERSDAWSRRGLPTPLTFQDKLKQLGKRRTAPTHRSFIPAIR